MILCRMSVFAPRAVMAALCVLGVAAVTACSSGPAAVVESSEPTAAAAAAEFEGLPSEWVELQRGCLESAGVQTGDEPSGDPTGFTVDTSTMAYEEYERVREECLAEVGQPPMSNLSEDELQQRYDARVEQWDCLVAAGLQSGSAVSFETFVSDYERSGQLRFWEPLEGADASEGEPVASCPRDAW